MTRFSKWMLALAAVTLLPTAAFAGEAEDAFQKGQIFAANKMYDKAVASYLDAAKADPEHYGIRANVSVAIVMGQMKQYDKASEILELIIQQHPDYPEIWLCYKVLGKVRTDQKRPGEAAEAYEAFLKAVPEAKLKPQDKTEITKQIALLKQQAAKSGAH